jgi:hypothetical protein
MYINKQYIIFTECTENINYKRNLWLFKFLKMGATGIFVKHSTVELMQSHTQVFRHSVTSDKNLWSQSISVNKNKT